MRIIRCNYETRSPPELPGQTTIPKSQLEIETETAAARQRRSLVLALASLAKGGSRMGAIGSGRRWRRRRCRCCCCRCCCCRWQKSEIVTLLQVAACCVVLCLVLFCFAWFFCCLMQLTCESHPPFSSCHMPQQPVGNWHATWLCSHCTKSRFLAAALAPH